MRTLLVFSVVSLGALVGLRAAPPDSSPWNPKAAASYLDGRATWWAAWPGAAKEQGTFCVSCHTGALYAVARPALRRTLGERAPSAPETALAANAAKRVALWRDVAPFFSDQLSGLPKTSESRGTESVVNALVVALRDAESGRFSDDLRAAFTNMWALQMKRQALAGTWAWINVHYEPWESDGGPYFGATLAAIAVGSAPGGYASSADAQDNVKLLRTYIQREFDRQQLFNKLMAVQASMSLQDLFTPEQRAAAIEAALAKQQDDGGWSMASLGSFKRLDETPIATASDGYATGLATLVLQQSGLSASHAKVARGLDWLRRNQNPTSGHWTATSLNKQRDPASDPGKFMDDAATAYAVLALTQAASQ